MCFSGRRTRRAGGSERPAVSKRAPAPPVSPPPKRGRMKPTSVLPIVAVLALVTVEYGGWALLTFISGREGLADWQKGFFRAGHAHAGVLLVLSLVYLLYLPRADFSDALEWVAGGVLLVGVLAQSGGFFLH